MLLFLIVPTLRVVTQRLTLCVNGDAERPGRHPHAERGYDQQPGACGVSGSIESPGFATAARQIVRMRPRHKPRSYRDRVDLMFLVRR